MTWSLTWLTVSHRGIMITSWLTDHQTLVIFVQLDIIVTLIVLQRLPTTLTVDGINTFDDRSCNRIIKYQS